jgi:hypothetical protein
MIKKIYNYLKDKISLNVYVFLRIATNDLYIVATLILTLLYVYAFFEVPSTKVLIQSIK